MAKKYIIPLIIFFVVAVAQVTVVPWIAVKEIAPALVVLPLVFFTLKYGQIYGTIIGFLAGIIFDFVSGGLIGLSMFSLTLTGFIAGYFYNDVKFIFATDTRQYIICLLVCSTVHFFAYSLTALSGLSFNFLALLIEHTMLPALYTTFAGVIMLAFRKKTRLE